MSSVFIRTSQILPKVLNGSILSNITRKFTSRRNMSDDQLDGRPLTIGTHDGVFHCDEALGCYLLKVLHPNAKIIRTRDQKKLDQCDIVLDVGSVYDPKLNRFDHHQQSFTHTMSTLSDIKSSVRLSSAGLIYHHFGRSILQKMTGNNNESALNYLYRELYYNLIQEIDGVDNGIPPYDVEPLYNICSHISNRIDRLNKPWLAAEDWDDTVQFHKAMEMAGEELRENIRIILEITYPAREIVQHAISTRYDVYHSGEIIELKQMCPWKNHMFELEAEKKTEPLIKYVIFEREKTFRVQCVPKVPGSFDCRKFLPKSWRGLRDEELSKIAGIDGCIFAHANGFIGGHLTREGALQMAIKSLESVE